MMDRTKPDEITDPTYDPHSVGARIRQARTMRLKIDQTALGKMLGVSAMAISRWENGANDIDEEFVHHLANALEVNYEWLLTGVSSDETMRDATDLLNLVNLVADNERYIIDMIMANLKLHLENVQKHRRR